MNYSNIPICNFTQLSLYLSRMYDNTWHVLEIKDEILDEMIPQLIFFSKNLIENEKFYIKESRVYNKKYFGLSLQNDGNSENTRYKSIKPLNGRPPVMIMSNNQQIVNELKNKNENKFIYLNDFAYNFKPLIDYFLNHNILLERGRLLKLKGPSAQEVIHADNDIRMHFPIITNQSCNFFFYDKNHNCFLYNLKQGHFYLFNAWINHSFINLSNQERTHLVFTLWNKS